MKKNSKLLVLAMALVLALGCAIGGTIAWLTAGTTVIKNTFTDSDVSVTLEETKNDFQMIPGHTIDKDPKVTVAAGSEACFLFVEVTESTDLLRYIDYDMAEGWNKLDGANGIVYYREVSEATTDQEFEVLANNKVSVLTSVTKPMMDDVENGTAKVELSFAAYVSQMYKDNTTKFTALDAWNNINKNDTSVTPITTAIVPAPSADTNEPANPDVE